MNQTLNICSIDSLYGFPTCNKIEFKKRFIKSDNTMNEQVCTLDCFYNGKKIHSINVKAFESVTKHKVSELIER